MSTIEEAVNGGASSTVDGTALPLASPPAEVPPQPDSAPVTEADSVKPDFPKKRLIVCCDGTWKTDDVVAKQLSNVAKIARCIDDYDDWKTHHTSQIVYYQQGVGLGTGWFANLRDAATGRGLSRSIKQAYTFICLNWTTRTENGEIIHDEIILNGFSRGAFAVRCLAQFIHDVGLLTKSGLRHLPKLFKLWKHHKDIKELEEFCTTLEKWGELRMRKNPKVEIQACAVWDTVSAIGMPVLALFSRPGRKKYLSVGKTVTPNIKLAIQALALDENRRYYEPEIWDPKTTKGDQKLVQSWFAGSHGDVGGNEANPTLSNICLAWMMGQLTDTVQFDWKRLWTITTSRDWSKPSPYKLDSTKDLERYMRYCEVVAEAPVSSALCKYQHPLTSLVCRNFGYRLFYTHGAREMEVLDQNSM